MIVVVLVTGLDLDGLIADLTFIVQMRFIICSITFTVWLLETQEVQGDANKYKTEERAGCNRGNYWSTHRCFFWTIFVLKFQSISEIFLPITGSRLLIVVQICVDYCFMSAVKSRDFQPTLTVKLNAMILSRVLFSCSSDSAVLTSSTGSSTENCPGPFSASLGDSTKLTVVVVGVGKQDSPKSYCNALLPSGELAITK